jgi:carbon starvation protein
LIPLVWLIAVTFTAGVQKMFHPDPRIGFLAQANELHQKAPALEKDLDAANATDDTIVITAAQESLRTNRMLAFNNLLDAAVAGTFLVLVAAIIFLSMREWVLLWSRRKLAVLHETEPVWLPDYALKEAGPDFRTAAGAAVIALGVAKELSGESHFERAQQTCGGHCSVNALTEAKSNEPSALAESGKRQRVAHQKIYVQITEQRFNGVRRCC